MITENKPRRARLGMLFWIAVMLLTVALDQYTKHLARTLLAPVGDVPLWDGILHLTYVENTGAAFGMMKNQRWIFLLFSTIAIIVQSSSGKSSARWAAFHLHLSSAAASET